MAEGVQRNRWPLGLIAGAFVALVAWVAIAATASAQENSVSASIEVVPVGGSGEFTVDVEAPAAGLGIWTIDVDYDSAVIAVTGCTAFAGADSNTCDEAFVADQTVRVTGFDGTGLMGAITLATFQFDAVGAGDECTDLTVTVQEFTDPNETPTNPTVTNGQVCIQAPTPSPSPSPSSTPSPTPTASPTPSPTAEGLPETGGSADNGSSNTAAYLLGILGLAVVGSGVFVATRTRKSA